MTDLYETLGVDRAASPAEIKRAYRRKAKAAHPDAGGSPEAFNELSMAHRVLTDDRRRQRYDATGNADDGPDLSDQRAMSIVDAILSQVMDMDTALQRDLADIVRREIQRNLDQQASEESKAKRQRAKLESIKARMKTSAENDPVGRLLAQKIAQVDAAMAAMAEQRRLFARAFEIMQTYRFEPAAAAFTRTVTVSTSMDGGTSTNS